MSFAQKWQSGIDEADDTETRLRRQLLGQLDEDDLLIQSPEWLAEEKTGFIDGETPAGFTKRIGRETKKPNPLR